MQQSPVVSSGAYRKIVFEYLAQHGESYLLKGRAGRSSRKLTRDPPSGSKETYGGVVRYPIHGSL